ncbi:site-2 protease family protein [Tersicoccus sp. Bi-70]|uniref:site-2 protease family protein n=1 Tax=Tersicoccus sp. Bi-70 TaxID=1897634 RepID=UPI000977E214|nr:site-2 protease family protein [Tersicoccus sp. Bi-70]OMH33019.1 peptidase M50 [Tersicoccus sp. Bi-70]
MSGAGTPPPADGTGRTKARSEGIPLGRMFSVPVLLSWSWFLIAAFIVISFGPVVAYQFPGIGAGAWFVALAYAVLLLLSVLAHELAHALSARAFGWPSSRIVLTLWGGHTSFESMPTSAGRSLVVALAGPAANLALAGVGSAVTFALPAGTVAWLLSSVFTVANLFVGVFNVLPGLPLDGGRIVESAVWRATGDQDRGTVAAGWAGRIVAVLILGVVLWPLFTGRGLPSLSTLAIGVLVVVFLWAGASAAIRSGRLKQRLGAISAGRLARPATGVPATASVAQLSALARDLRTGPGTELILVDDRGVPVAVADRDAVAAVPFDRAATTGAVAVARPLAPGAVVPVASEGHQLVQYLARLAGSEYAVIDARGVVTGLLTQGAVLTALQGRTDPWS